MSSPELESPMGQCAVTGKMVPEDELVTIQGQRVCAEGKAILLDRLKAGEAMPGEVERPTVGKRFLAIFVDGLIIGVPIAIINGVATAAHSAPALIGLITVVATAIQVIYFGQMHAMRGQTVGKIATKLKVVNLDGSPITLPTAYVRALVYSGWSVLSGLAVMTGSPALVMVASLIVGVWGLANVLAALFDRSMQRALHDRIAGTRVIQLPG